MRLLTSYLSVSLLTFSVQAAPVLSNSPHSPYRQLRTLMEDMNGLKEEIQELKSEKTLLNNVLETVSQEAQHRNLVFEQLTSENEALKDTLQQLTKDYEALKSNLVALEENQKGLLENSALESVKEQLKSANENVNHLSQWKEDREKFLKELQLKLPNINKLSQELCHIQTNTENFIKVSYEEICNKIQSLERDIDKVTSANAKAKSNDFQFQLSAFKKEITDKCKAMCLSTLNQANDRLQSLAQQMQTNFDCLREKSYIKHIVLAGESLSSIANRYQSSVSQILAANHLQNSKNVKVGDMIWIPKNF